MQSEEPRIHILLTRMKFLFVQVVRNFLQKEVLDKSEVFYVNLNENNLELKDSFYVTKVEIFIKTSNVNTHREKLYQFPTEIRLPHYFFYCHNKFSIASTSYPQIQQHFDCHLKI